MTAIADVRRASTPEAAKASETTKGGNAPAAAAPAAPAPAPAPAQAPWQVGLQNHLALAGGRGRPSSIGLPGMPGAQAPGTAPLAAPPAPATDAATPPAPAAPAPVADYGTTFGGASYVKDGTNKDMLGLMTRAVAASPELANGPLGKAVQAGNVGPAEVKALQDFLTGKGYSVGRTGSDGKFGPNTHAGLASFLKGEAPNQPTPAPAPAPGPEGPGSDAAVGDPKTWHISQYPSASNPNEDVARNGNCGPTSVLMVAKAFGKANPSPKEVDNAIEDVRRRGGATMEERVGHGSGTSIGQLSKAARSFGLTTETQSRASLADVQKQLAAGKQVIALVKPGGYSNSRSQGHYVVVTKIEGGKVYLNDPASRTGPTVVSAAGFQRAMNMKGGDILAIGR